MIKEQLKKLSLSSLRGLASQVDEAREKIMQFVPFSKTAGFAKRCAGAPLPTVILGMNDCTTNYLRRY